MYHEMSTSKPKMRLKRPLNTTGQSCIKRLNSRYETELEVFMLIEKVLFRGRNAKL